jgi:hypothetical protein
LHIEKTDRDEGRARLGIPASATVILVVPGGADFHSEEKAPVADLILKAYNSLEQEEKRLVWVVGDPDHGMVAEKTNGRRDVVVLRAHLDFTPTMLACDLLITKGNRLPLLEAEALGIPSISISHGYNSVDDHRVALIRSNTALRARGLTPVSLRGHLLHALGRRDLVRRGAPDGAASGARLGPASSEWRKRRVSGG